VSAAAPFHVAVIMDGNGRWAGLRGRPRLAGHRAGVEAVRRTIQAAPQLGITTLTLYAFSQDNWKRPALEVGALMDLLRDYLEREARRCADEGVRLNLIGRRDRLPAAVVEAAEGAERLTAGAGRLHLRLAVDYSSRWAIAEAARCALERPPVDEVGFSAILNEVIGSRPAAPDVDLLIRTSGERRLSDFLLWESAYAELHFTEVMWPDFGGEELARAVDDFRRRERRFGGLTEVRATS
jgi:undecaprenyl diphosphate synthase